ncbi:hypothetical protein [Streptomyces sp. CBMA29]|uniref:hypothetical protein n=1 Tax=Streptomyces sp. CBMA29 TaxID=1896314 RepID=UPI0016619EF3|nr:hypothetical protein [Streptomyces sp. CBMA29]
MDGFAEAMLERVRVAREAVAAAGRAGDAYALAVACDELDDALRIARANGVEADLPEDEGGGAESGG